MFFPVFSRFDHGKRLLTTCEFVKCVFFLCNFVAPCCWSNPTTLKPQSPYGRVILIKNKVLFKDRFLNNDPFEDVYSLNEKAVHYEPVSMSISTRNTSTSETLIESFTTSTSVNANSFLGPVANHYQVITICNTLPSILKCQNRQHFLILHKIIYGISESRSQTNCDMSTQCMQVDEKDEFNCTGSNVCVIYPIDRYLRACDFVKSNLTQIHLTCVKLGWPIFHFILKFFGN